MQDLVSVIIPVYKVQEYLETCVDSVLKQTYKNLDIILVDDGSPDRCGEMCNTYALIDTRVRVIHKDNGGLSSARNAGMKIAKANYWCFIDSDDWISENMIETMMNIFEKKNVDIVCCGRILQDSDQAITLSVKENVFLDSQEAIKKSFADREVGIAAWGKIYRKTLFDGIDFPEGEIHEDVAIMPRIFDKARGVYVLSEPLYFYRYNSEGISKGVYNNKFDVVLRHVLENEKFILSKYPQIKLETQAMVASSCYGMMIKVLKTPNGYEQFNQQFIQYRKYYIKNISAFKRLCCRGIKDYIWMLVMIGCNSMTIRLFRKIGVAK